MALIVEFAIPPDALLLGDALVENSDIEIEVDRIVPTGEKALPFFWVWGAKPDIVLAHATEEPAFADVKLLEAVGNGGL